MQTWQIKSVLPLFILITLILSLRSLGQNRDVVLINKDWHFILEKDSVQESAQGEIPWQNITVPHTWNNKDIQSGEKVHYGTAWYKRELNIIRDVEKQYFLRFEGVGQYAEVYLNNKYVGEHLGSYSAFAFNITSFLNDEGKNSILVKVNNELNDSYPKDNFLFGIYGGIYRNVWLIETGDLHISITDHASTGVYVSQEGVSNEKAMLKITSMIKNESSEIKEVSIVQKLLSESSDVITQSIEYRTIYPGGLYPVVSYLEVKSPHLWNGKIDPHLYRLQTTVVENDKENDRVEQSIGIRYFSIDPEIGFLLNGKPYRLYGVCRHQEWKDLGNALLPKHHKFDMDLINELGATTIRFAHYQQDDYVYSLADSMGILIWAEIPFVNGYKDNANGNAIQQLTELIKQNYNHPSIFVWGVHNEVIKGKSIQDPVNLTSELHNLAKHLDPDRYTVAVSNIWWVHDHPIHELTDIQGFNQYTGWYGGKPEELSNWINNYHNKKPGVRFSVSEYGAGGNIAHQSFDISEPPHPKSQFFPEAYHTLYHEVTYSSMEKYPFIWASYIWNMFDFSVPEWDRGGVRGLNHKGLVTYDRKTKKDAFYWYKANWSDESVLFLPGKRNNVIDTNIHTIKAYCNYGIPELFVNGKSYGKMQPGINKVQYVSDKIQLNPGNNQIEIIAESDDKILKDKFILLFEVKK